MRQPRTPVFPRHVVLLAAMLAVAACGGATNTTDEATVDVAAETAEQEAADADLGEAGDEALADADASAPAGTAELPAWFPDDVYVPEAYTVVGAMDVGTVQRLELRADGTVAEVREAARAGMQAQGWTEGPDTGDSIAWTKGDRSAMVTVNERDDGAARVGYQFMTL